jgi:hypothetical protein
LIVDFAAEVGGQAERRRQANVDIPGRWLLRLPPYQMTLYLIVIRRCSSITALRPDSSDL